MLLAAERIRAERLGAKTETPYWYIIRTAPRFVETLYAQCNQVGVDLYYPVYARRVAPRRARRDRIVKRPAFPGYAFVPTHQAERMRLLPHYRYQFLRTGPEQWVYVSDDLVQDIKASEAEWCQYEVDPKPVERFKVGDRVRIRGDLWGPMTVVGYVGSTVKLESERMEIRVDPALLEHVE